MQAAGRAANLKGAGLSTARHDATRYYYSVVPGSLPPDDEDGADLWGGAGRVNEGIRALLWILELGALPVASSGMRAGFSFGDELNAMPTRLQRACAWLTAQLASLTTCDREALFQSADL